MFSAQACLASPELDFSEELVLGVGAYLFSALVMGVSPTRNDPFCRTLSVKRLRHHPCTICSSPGNAGHDSVRPREGPAPPHPIHPSIRPRISQMQSDHLRYQNDAHSAPSLPQHVCNLMMVARREAFTSVRAGGASSGITP
ncbi:hypothetical protein OH77DRAFT_1417313 [Trametes cingulata]|nr:hypothetical protein OH77DRAFT_1417313 [Trametes cingulata]